MCSLAKRLFSWVSLGGLLLSCPVFGQAVKPELVTEDDYAKWHDLGLVDVSADGRLLSYAKYYHHIADTLFVGDRQGKQFLAVPGGWRGKFTAHAFVCAAPERKLLVWDVSTKVAKMIDGVDDFTILHNGGLLLSSHAGHSLRFTDHNGNILDTFAGVTAYKVDDVGQNVVISQTTSKGSTFVLLKVNSGRLKTVWSGDNKRCKPIAWDETGRFLGLHISGEEDENYLLLYDSRTGEVKRSSLDKALPNSEITEAVISSDGLRMAWSILLKRYDSSEGGLCQIWNSLDPFPYSAKRSQAYRTQVSVWDTRSGDIRVVTDSVFAGIMLSRDLKFALVHDTNQYQPSVKAYPDRDMFVLNIEENDKELLVSKLAGESNKLSVSDNGKWVCYFKDDHWHLYNRDSQTTHNITARLPYSFSDEGIDLALTAKPYGKPVWSKGGKMLYLYDQYDIWQHDLEHRTTRRLTAGRERGIVFRFAITKENTKNGLISKCIVSVEGEMTILSATAEDFTMGGYYGLKGSKLIRLSYEKAKVAQPMLAENGRFLFWRSESFDSPPQIISYDLQKLVTALVVNSNPHHSHYAWGKAEVIKFNGDQGKTLTGVLYYPAKYDRHKSYPMVVHIYERQTFTLHTFKNPSLFTGAGINRTNLTQQGYFVLYPDIRYEHGKVGESVLDCVTAAVEKAISVASIDRNRLGLIGHSFGGFEVNYFIGRSKLFKAAVSGASINDLVSLYFSMGDNTKLPETFRFEYDQFRMIGGFYEKPESYLNYSPVYWAKNIDTALLSWTGEKDTQVPAEQSMELHMAMRRLGKPHTLLIYPNEGHSLDRKENQIDLTRRVEAFFREHLKP